MKTELQAKFLQHLNRKNQEKGFTLIELLVVIIIIGILAAIALPNFLNQSAKAKQSEAKNTVSSVNSAQTAYRQEKSLFASTMDQLALGLPTATLNYTYTFSTGTTDLGTIVASSGDAALKGYAGGTARYTNTTTSESIINSVVCEAAAPGGAASAPTNTATGATCAAADVTLGQE